MSDYLSNITLHDAARIANQASSVLITTHAKPDGDAIGSVVAAAAALKSLGKTVHAVLAPPVHAGFAALRGSDIYRVYEKGMELPATDLVLVLDTGAWTQLGHMKDALTQRINQMMILDHHISGDIPARHKYIDASAAACCEIVSQWIDLLPNAASLYTPVVCDAIYAGVASDTGWFRFSNTRPFTHELAARLQRLGVVPADLYRKLEQNERPQKLQLMIRAMESLQLLADSRVAMMTLRAKDFAETGALIEETERFVDIPQIVQTVEMVVLVTEPPPAPKSQISNPKSEMPASSPAIRVSFRSKAGPGAVNVAQVAQSFGGGGHARAAAAKIHAPLADAVAQVSSAVVKLFPAA